MKIAIVIVIAINVTVWGLLAYIGMPLYFAIPAFVFSTVVSIGGTIKDDN